MLKESETLELKASVGEWKEVIVALAAFANKRGGKVIIGVDDRGEPLGRPVGKGAVEELANKIKQHTDPVLYPSVNVKTFGLGEIIEVGIAENDNKPVFAFEKAYLRVGRVNQKLSTAAIRELIKRYTLPDFDGRPVDADPKTMTFDTALIKELDKAHYRLGAKSELDFLKRSKLMAKGRISNAGYLCFTEQNALMRNAVVKAARFKGVGMTRMLDMKDFDGPLLRTVDGAMDFIKRHVDMEVVIEGKARRQEVWDYPLIALREAVTNALVHRDYTDPGNVQIRIFDDRIEIWSPGLLPKEIHIRDVLKESRSIPRNKALVEIFHRAGQIEGWGSGFGKMYHYSVENGNGEPSLAEMAGAFVVAFRRREKRKGKAEGINEGTSEGMNRGISEGISRLGIYVARHPGQRTVAISKALGVPPKTLERWLKSLREQGRIEYRGSKRTGGYYVVSAT